MMGPRHELVAQPLRERTFRIEPHHIAQVAVHELVVVGPAALARLTPRKHALHLIADAPARLGGFLSAAIRCKLLDVLKQSLHLRGVAQEDLVQFGQRARRLLEQCLASLDRREPVARQERADAFPDALLLGIKPALPALDAAHEIRDRDPEWSDHVGAPTLGRDGPSCCSEDLGDARDEGPREKGEALLRQGVFFKEEVDDRGGEWRHGVLARLNRAVPVDAREQPLLAEALDRMRRALARVRGVRLRQIAYLLIDVEQCLLLEGRDGRAFGAKSQAEKEAEIGRVELELGAVLLQRRERARTVHHRMVPVHSRRRPAHRAHRNLHAGRSVARGQFLPDLIGRIDRALEHPGALPSYSAFLRAVNQAARGGLGPVLAAYDTARVDYHDLSTAVDACVFQSLAREVLEADSRLRSHAGATHEAVKARFQELDREILELHRRQLASTLLATPVPSGNGVGPKSQWTELALLQHQVSLKRSTLPMRALFTRAGAAIQTLKPCFMMSPMSVAQHLPGGGLHFDIVIMDEASQLRPEDALGAIARGRQVVVVGDPQQLPPTSFFEKVEADAVSDDEEEDDTRALESILDLAMASFRPVRRLKWHYRSEHPSLIAFSNHEFYSDDPLIIFPSPFTSHPDRGVRLVEVDGTYSDRRNDAEASAIVEEAAELMRRRPDVSLGIVALNQPQRELLEAKLDALFAADPAAEAYRQRRTRSLEPLFVKNLENVQGDERDVIFISTVYGRNEEGALFQRFGPINSATGHRRLNVLFTRAKRQVVIFSSLRPGDIRVEETTRRGVRVLRAYLEFAKSGALTQPEFTSREPDSDFERWFISRLGREGFEVVPQLGVAGFFLDVAVRHPDEPGSFILGVECDGRTYHSSRSARDRDRLRQKILEDRGWQLHRVWSTDWFRNPEYEFKRLIDRIRALRATGRAAGNGQ